MTGDPGSRARANTGETIWNQSRYLACHKLSINKVASEAVGKGEEKGNCGSLDLSYQKFSMRGWPKSPIDQLYRPIGRWGSETDS